MCERFVLGKKYRFDPTKYILLEGIGDFIQNINWISKVMYEFEITKDTNMIEKDTICVFNNLVKLPIEWCICMDDKVKYLGLVEDTYGASVVVYMDENDKIKTKHYKLFEELLER